MAEPIEDLVVMYGDDPSTWEHVQIIDKATKQPIVINEALLKSLGFKAGLDYHVVNDDEFNDLKRQPPPKRSNK